MGETKMVNEERDENSGRFTGYNAADFTDAIRAINDRGALADTGRVADEVGCHRETARRRLNNLADEGRISRMNVGQALVWSVDGDGGA